MRLIVLCAAALGGVAVGDVCRLEPGRLVLGGLLAVLGAGLAWRRTRWRMLALVTLAAAMGGLRAAQVPADDTAALEPYVDLVVRLRGVVVQPPNVGPASAQLLVDVHALGPAGRDPPASDNEPQRVSRVRVVGDPSALGALAPSDLVVLEGRLVKDAPRAPPTLLFPRLLGREPPASFELAPVLAGVRAAAQAGIAHNLPEPHASLAAGVLLGGSGRLEADFRSQLQRSGLAHIVAIDGFKQVIVATVLGAVAVRLFGQKTAALAVLVGIAGYTLLTGAHPSAVRAGLMVGLAALATLTGRLADPLTSVMLAATLMAAVEPHVLLDIGLQLSLSAMLGIILLWPRLQRRLHGLPRLIAEPAGLTLAVTLATLPVTLSVFQQVSLVSPLAHVVAMPLLPLVLVSAALLAVASPLQPLATVVSWFAWLPSTLLVEVTRFFGNLPGAALSTGRLPPVAAVGLAAALLAWGLWGLPEAADLRRRWTRARASIGPRLWAPALCLAMCLALTTLLQLVRPDGRLHIQPLAVGRGEAVFIRGPTGRTALIVTGRLDAVQLANQVADRLTVWEHQLDSVVQLDQAAHGGLGLTLARYAPVQQLDVTSAARVDLGGGAALDVSAPDRQPKPEVSISFGRIQLALFQADTQLVSDGSEVWPADGLR
jgi:competence protein ComEC